jgi:hypothetical protein
MTWSVPLYSTIFGMISLYTHTNVTVKHEIITKHYQQNENNENMILNENND